MGQLSRVYTQLKDGRGKGEYVLIYFIKIGTGDKKRSIICQSLYFISVFKRLTVVHFRA